MIIPSKIRAKYDLIQQDVVRLKNDIDPVLLKIAERTDGYYISRLKPIESFILKLESGKFKPDDIIDLLAATIVVPSVEYIVNVEKEIESKFIIHKKDINRKKAPESFIYDDMHLHISFNPALIIPGKNYLHRKFELQIKTLLQYSWSKATHNILYKTNQLLWPNYRVAYQTKAMLEQADQILYQIVKMADICPDNKYEEFIRLNEIIMIIQDIWNNEQLPHNIRRLAENIASLIAAYNIKINPLKVELKKAENQDLIEAVSITPYQAIVGILIRNDYKKLIRGIKKRKIKILLTQELRDILGTIHDDLEQYIIKLD